MSETVHYTGTATIVDIPKDKTVNQFAKDILKERNKEIAEYYDDATDCLCDTFYNEFFYHSRTGVLYEIIKSELDSDYEVIRAKKRDNGIIDFELRYYNGGASFNECLEEAIDKLI